MASRGRLGRAKKPFPAEAIRKFYDNPDVCSKFEQIRNKLQAEINREDPYLKENRSLASIISDFLLFQERFLGPEVLAEY